MRRREFLLSLTAATILSGCGSAPPIQPGPIPPPPPPDPPPPPPPPVPVLGVTRLLAFGDSMTEGVVSPARAFGALTAGLPRSYPFKLQTLVSQRYTDQSVTVLNAGFAGRRADADSDRLKGALAEAKPELLLLWHGANDLLALDRTTGAALDEGIAAAAAAVEDLVRDGTARGARVMLATQTPAIRGLQRGGAAPYLPQFNDRLKAVAARRGVQIVDLFTEVPAALVGQDGLHLTEEGFQRVAEVFLLAIEATYELAPNPTAR
jgi:lysophospholipase L1-like esterase